MRYAAHGEAIACGSARRVMFGSEELDGARESSRAQQARRHAGLTPPRIRGRGGCAEARIARAGGGLAEREMVRQARLSFGRLKGKVRLVAQACGDGSGVASFGFD